MARRLIVPTDKARAPAADQTAGVFFARTFRELTPPLLPPLSGSFTCGLSGKLAAQSNDDAVEVVLNDQVTYRS